MAKNHFFPLFSLQFFFPAGKVPCQKPRPCLASSGSWCIWMDTLWPSAWIEVMCLGWEFLSRKLGILAQHLLAIFKLGWNRWRIFCMKNDEQWGFSLKSGREFWWYSNGGPKQKQQKCEEHRDLIINRIRWNLNLILTEKNNDKHGGFVLKSSGDLMGFSWQVWYEADLVPRCWNPVPP